MRMLVLLLIQYFFLIFSGETFTASAFIPQTKLISQPKWKHHPQKDIDVPLLSTFMTASSMDSGSGDKPFNVDIVSNDTTDSNTDEKKKKFDMPWTDIQQFAIQDNISKFTVTIPEMGRDSTSKAKQYVMWRALTREVPELAGYPISFLQQKLTTQLGILPLVDDFEFTSNGGISGRAYGLQGIADGTKIQTPPLIGAETTVPLGYITTQGDASTSENIGFSYELGLCSSLDSIGRTTGRSDGTALAAARRLILDDGALLDTTKQVAGAANDIGTELLSDQEANRDMIYLGGATTFLVVAATAVGMLSHHLTVNVFWV